MPSPTTPLSGSQTFTHLRVRAWLAAGPCSLFDMVCLLTRLHRAADFRVNVQKAHPRAVKAAQQQNAPAWPGCADQDGLTDPDGGPVQFVLKSILDVHEGPVIQANARFTCSGCGMNWCTEDDGQETTFHCVNILTGEIVSLADDDQTELDLRRIHPQRSPASGTLPESARRQGGSQGSLYSRGRRQR